MPDLAVRSDTATAHALVDERSQQSLDTVRAALRIGSFSDTGEGIEAGAEHFVHLLSRICPDAAVVRTDGWPVVLGTVSSPVPTAPTLVVYGLYDVTPTLAEQWTVDPLAATIVDASELGLVSGLGPVVVGRGANNHKGPVISAILAVEALLDSGVDLPVNLVFVIEGEEEIGSPSLPAFVAQHADLLSSADGVWLPCMQQNTAGVMSLRRSYKGSVFTQLTCRGGPWGGPADGRHVWAGNSAWIDAPMMQLVKALGSLYDEQQRTTIDGLEQLEQSARAEASDWSAALADDFRAHPTWQANLLQNLHVDRALAGKDIADHLEYYMTGVTMNIQGIVGGYQGPTFYTMLPGEASARVDFRFPPGITPDEFCAALRAHLDRRGFTHVELVMPRGYAGSPALADEADHLLAAALRTAGRAGVETAVWPIANNCCPASLFTGFERQLPFSVAGLGHGDRAHAPDEYFTVDSVRALMHFTVDHLADVADATRSADSPT